MKNPVLPMIFTLVMVSGIFAETIPAPMPVTVLAGARGVIKGLYFTADGSIMLAGADSFIRKFSLTDPLKRSYAGAGMPVSGFAYSAKKGLAATTGQGMPVKLWDEKGLTLIKQSAPQSGQAWNVNSLAFTPDGDYLAASRWAGSKAGIWVWQVETMKAPYEADLNTKWAQVTAFSPDNSFFLAAGGRSITLWESEYGNLASLVTGKGGIGLYNRRDFDFKSMVFDAVFTPDSQYFIACGDDGTVKAWRARDGLIAWKQAAHNGMALCLAVSKDSLATSGKDGMINFFNPKTGKPLSSLSGFSDGINRLAFSKDGRYLAAACDDFSVRVWDLKPGFFTGPWKIKLALYSAGLVGIIGLLLIIRLFFKRKKQD